jgi:hypothetical protein
LSTARSLGQANINKNITLNNKCEEIAKTIEITVVLKTNTLFSCDYKDKFQPVRNPC